jgi:V/A-type H+/Na+-transporting ATPase subunit E
MKTLEKGQDKIQKICDKIRHETIEPAKEEAHQIIQNAKKKAEEIIAEAERQAKMTLEQARDTIEQERNIFNSSLVQASKQAVESLRQNIEQKLFNEQLESILDKQLSNPKVIADLINSLVKSIEKEGLNTDLNIIVPKTVSSKEIAGLLVDEVHQRLKNHPIEVGPFAGGIQVKLIGKRMTVDLSDKVLKELLSSYARKDFRQIIFS